MQSPDRINARLYGSTGPNVAMLHGGPGAPGEMKTPAYHLSKHYRIVEPLQRTSGSMPLTVDRHVKDLHDVLRKPLTEGPLRIVGFSWGAMLALTYAARYPSSIDRVILIGCGTFDLRTREVYQNAMAQRMNTDERELFHNLQSELAHEKDCRRRNKLFKEMGTIATSIQSFNPLAPTQEELIHCDEKSFRETWGDAMSLQEKEIQPAEFSHIQAPVTMIHGDMDPHPGLLIYETLKPIIRDIRYYEVLKCGHKPWIEREAKERFYELMVECLN
ncbi:alpha/beta fold hydrolase [Candidatus Latescibacterota bacterium]